MLQTKLTTATALLLLAGVIGSAGPSLSFLGLNEALADSSPAAHPSDVDRLPPEAARMYACVTKPHPNELKWQQVPWLVDLAEGIRLAKQEKRPLLIFVSGDDPLEKC